MSSCRSDQQTSFKADEITLVPGYFWVDEVYGISPPAADEGWTVTFFLKLLYNTQMSP